MKDFKDFTIDDFKQMGGNTTLTAEQVTSRVAAMKLRGRRSFASFYRIKPGCYKAEVKKLDYCKLSDVL